MCTFCENTFVFGTRQSIQLNKKLDIDGLVQQALNQLYNDRKVDKKTAKKLAQSHYEPLKEAVEEGYGKSLFKVEYNTPNYEFLKALQTNAAVFATFKSHAATKQMAGLLKDAEGNLKPKEQFVREALAVDATYRKQYLDTEYDTAVRQARMAANWQRYEKNKRLYPNLRYVRSKAAKPDETHLQYVGINRPVDDPFWNSHYPPNRWRCQCSVEPNDDDVTDIPDKLPPVDPVFAFNSGKTQQVFDLEKSEYIKSVSAAAMPGLIRDAEKMVVKDVAANLQYQPIYSSKAGNVVLAHPMAFDNGDFDDCVKAARELANNADGPKSIQILPDLFDPELRAILLPNVKGSKNPDFRIDGKYIELKEPEGEKPGSRTFKNLLRDALEQSSGAALVIPEGYCNKETLTKEVGRIYKHDDFKDFPLWVRFQNKWQAHTQESWRKWYQEVHKTTKPRRSGA